MTPVAVPFELLLPGGIFAAGGFYFVVRSTIAQLGQHIDRLGAKLRDSDDHAATNQYRIAIILLATCADDQREKLANMLLQGIIGHEPI